MDQGRGRIAAIIFAVACAAQCVNTFAEGPRRHYHLDSDDAIMALSQFSRQSDIQVLYDYVRVQGIRTHAVEGEMDASEALNTMLQGTHLKFEFVNSHTIAVTPK